MPRIDNPAFHLAPTIPEDDDGESAPSGGGPWPLLPWAVDGGSALANLLLQGGVTILGSLLELAWEAMEGGDPTGYGDKDDRDRDCGWVEYGDLDAAHGNRATGMTACLDEEYLATHKGTDTDKHISPPGHEWAQRTAGYLGADASYSINKCHLLAKQLTGSGTDLRNLATCARGANFPDPGSSQGTNNMRTYEKQIKAAIDAHQDVYYEVKPDYQGNRTVPKGFTIVARGVNQDGSPGVQINAYVPNELNGRNLGTFDDPYTGRPVPVGSER